ncbi:MAG: GNAT family N-acetyltransferase [Acidobacteriota bacterium]|nr:GNAT family N-acetyltransferase [Acidobacteriota bacterium]
MKICLRRAAEADLDFVLAAEHSPDNSPFVTRWTREQHAGSLLSEDVGLFIIESESDQSSVGYVIMAGLTDQNQSIELRRIVVTEKNKGYGQQALDLIKRLAFVERGAHRLWLDVKEENFRARHIYESHDFVIEGVLRECIKSELGFGSLVVMSMLRDEYQDSEKRRPSAVEKNGKA